MPLSGYLRDSARHLLVPCSAGALRGEPLCLIPLVVTAGSIAQAALLVPLVFYRVRALRQWRPPIKGPKMSMCRPFRLVGLVIVLLILGLHTTLLVLLRTSPRPDADPQHQVDAAYSLRLAIGAMTWLVCLGVVLLEATYRRHAGAGLRLWWCVAAVLSFASTPQNLASAATEAHAAAEYLLPVNTGLLLLLGVLALLEPSTPSEKDGTVAAAAGTALPLLADDHSSGGGEGGSLPSHHGEATASFLSRLYFLWCHRLLKLGTTRALEHSSWWNEPSALFEDGAYQLKT